VTNCAWSPLGCPRRNWCGGYRSRTSDHLVTSGARVVRRRGQQAKDPEVVRIPRVEARTDGSRVSLRVTNQGASLIFLD
jgi:hypothetical protein